MASPPSLAERAQALRRAALLAGCRRTAACRSFDDVLALGRVPAFLETLERWLAGLSPAGADAAESAALATLWREFTDVFPFVHPGLCIALLRAALAAGAGVSPGDRATLLQEQVTAEVLWGRAVAIGPILAEAERLAAASGDPWIRWSVPYSGALAAVHPGRLLSARRYVERAARLLPALPPAPLSYPSRFRRSNPRMGTFRLEGDIAAGLGFGRRAARCYRRALAAIQPGTRPDRVGYMWLAFAALWWRLGRLPLAGHRLERVLARARVAGTRSVELEVTALARLAVLRWDDGRRRAANLAALERAAASSNSRPLREAARQTAALSARAARRERLRRSLGLPPLRRPPPTLPWLAEQLLQVLLWCGAVFLRAVAGLHRRVPRRGRRCGRA